MPEDAKKIAEAARTLVKKIDLVLANKSYSDVWAMAHAHGWKYDGPSFGQELEELKKLLS